MNKAVMLDFCQIGRTVIAIESQAIADLSEHIDASFETACKYLLACRGRIIISGMGKSGHIARKIASTFSSIGSPAFFVHPGEASHGDLGGITAQDVMLIVSYSGSTSEILLLLPIIKRLNIPLITLTGNEQSQIAQYANVNLNISIKQEACPLGLAPTASTTAALVMGDALAIALLKAKDFKAEDFARAHPGGLLGKRLLLCVHDIAHHGTQLPIITEFSTVSDAIIEITNKKLGMACVINELGCLSGIYTDGDIRRTLTHNYDIKITQVHEVMTRECRTIAVDALAIDALRLMRNYNITSLISVNAQHQPISVVHIHDLLRIGMN